VRSGGIPLIQKWQTEFRPDLFDSTNVTSVHVCLPSFVTRTPGSYFVRCHFEYRAYLVQDTAPITAWITDNVNEQDARNRSTYVITDEPEFRKPSNRGLTLNEYQTYMQEVLDSVLFEDFYDGGNW